MKILEKHYRVKDLAKFLVCSEKTIHRLIGEGEFPRTFPLRGGLRIPLGDIEAYISRQVAKYQDQNGIIGTDVDK